MWGEETIAHPQLPWLMQSAATLPHHPRALFLGFVCLSSFFLRVTSTSLLQLPRWHISNHSYAWRMLPFTIVFISSFSSKWKKKSDNELARKEKQWAVMLYVEQEGVRRTTRSPHNSVGLFELGYYRPWPPSVTRTRLFLIDFVKISDWGWS